MKTKIAFLAVLLLPALLVAADEMSDLRAKFQSRDAKIRELKKAGAVGETFQGYLDAPQSATAESQTLMTDENADRKRLYALIAQKEGATAEAVADRAARRNFGLAKTGEMLKTPNGWKAK